MEEDIQCTPPEIQKKWLETPFEILPQKSVKKYNRQYDIFMEWCKKHGIKKYSENILLAYFFDLSEEYSPSSLWSYYSMVKATLSEKNDVDISKYKKLTAFLKQKGRNHVPKKSKTLSQEEILKFLLDAPDEIYLMMKICVVFGIAGALRNEELLNLKVSDIEHKETILVVHITKTKTNRTRLFVITSEFERKVKSIELFNKYLALRPKQTLHDRFFIAYRNGKCTVQPVGIHTFTEGGKATGLHSPMLRNLCSIKTVLVEGQIDNMVVTNDNSTKNLQIVNINNNPQTFSIQTPWTSGINVYNASGCTFTFNITKNK